MITTLGRETVRRKLPDGFKDWADKPLDKKTLAKLTTQLALADSDKYVDILQELNGIGERVVSSYGRDASLSYSELKSGKAVNSMRMQLKALIEKVLDDPNLTEEQKEERITQLGYKYTQKIEDAVFQDQEKQGTALATQINSGSRGNKTQLTQFMFGNMMMKDALNRDIPYLHVSPFMSGTGPMDYWVAASSGRKGMYDVQAATGNAGYLGKKATNVTHDVVIEKDDCGTTDTGMPFKAADTQNVGRVLLRPFHKHPAGAVVTPEMIAEADDDEEMLLRTPMTCKCAHGVCAKCNGLSETGKFPGVGSYVALNSARTFIEKITQTGISCLAPDTQVRMGDGSLKAIKDIQPGDMVMGVEADGTLKPAAVKWVFDNGTQPMATRCIGDYAVITCTGQHRVLSGSGRMSEIADCVNVKVINYMAGTSESMDITECGGEMSIQAYDLEVDNDTHWYLLGCGVVTHNSKHTGGVGGKKVVDPDGEDQPTGFESIERMFESQTNFPGGAVLTPVDGIVSGIRPAPQGGNYITVGATTLYCSPERTFKVKPGDKVTAGDVLTNGVPSPAEVVKYKGIGKGRRYYMDKLGEILKKSGFGVDRSNIESFSRAMINKVTITDPDGYRSWLPGDTANYSELAADYKPRENATEETPDKAVNKYLEQPVLYYSIGTRITPAIAQEMHKYGFDKITVSPDPAPFESKFLRPAAALQSDPHWLPRMAGERLRDSIFDAARKGMTDDYDSTSYVDKIVALPFK